MKNQKEFKDKSEKELITILNKEKDKLMSLKFDLLAGKVKDVREIRKTKKDIARILTISNSNHAKT